MSKLDKQTGRAGDAEESRTDSPEIPDLAPDEADEDGVTGGGKAPISGGVLNGKAISLAGPAYPPIQ